MINNSKIKADDSILVLTSSSTGNNVFCTPAIRFMRKHLPGSVIDVAALSTLSAEVFAGNPDINHTHVVTTRRTFDRLAAGYSKVIALNANALKKLAGFKTPLIVMHPMVEDIHHADQLLAFVAKLLDRDVDEEDRQYVISSISQDEEPALSHFSVSENDVLVNIHLGCGRTLLHGWKFFYKDRANDKKLWPVDEYIRLGSELIKANPNIRIVLTGTKNESFLAKKFEQNVPGTINLAGKTSVTQLRELMQQIDLFIAHDCGVLHIAAASDVPVVCLFGPTNSRLTGPYPGRPQHAMIKKEAMSDISPAEVVNASLSLLGKFPRKRNRNI